MPRIELQREEDRFPVDVCQECCVLFLQGEQIPEEVSVVFRQKQYLDHFDDQCVVLDADMPHPDTRYQGQVKCEYCEQPLTERDDYPF